jgi:predicted alpha/beta hydrolase
LLAHRGIALAPVEWRGTGTSALRAGYRSDWGYRELLDDGHAALRAAQAAEPQRTWLLGGHSMGGQLAAILAALVESPCFADARRVEGVVLVATGLPHWKLYRGRMRWGVRAFAAALPALTAAVGHFPGRALRFAGREARGVMLDWRHSAVEGKYVARGLATDLDLALANLALPACAIALEQDALAPVESLRGLLAKMPKLDATLQSLGAQTLGTTPDHFGWMKRPDAIVATIASWAEAQGERFAMHT